MKKLSFSFIIGLILSLFISAASVTPLYAAEAKKPVAKKVVKKSAQKKAASQKKSPKKTAQKSPIKKVGTPSGAKNDLARVQQEIKSTENKIRLSQEQREQKETELKQAEVEIGELQSNMDTLKQSAGSHEQRLQALRLEKISQAQQRDQLMNLIRSDLRMAQRQGGEDYYKLLLNQQDPQTLARLMKYYGYMQQARGTRVHQLNTALTRLDEIAQQEEKELAQLQNIRNDLHGKQKRLAGAQAERNKAIRVLSAQIESDSDKLQRLQRNQQALQSVIERLAREAAAREAERRRQEQARLEAEKSNPSTSTPTKIPAPIIEKPDFQLAPYAGRCPLPVAGGIRASFGSSRAGGLRWNGIVVAATAGTGVHAVLPGKVAFADYLRGYGFLIIVDHGRGLMSLYGQNQTLLKKAGESVAGKEVIARVGDGAGNDTDGLYFEIRMRGKPVDPANWCAYQ